MRIICMYDITCLGDWKVGITRSIIGYEDEDGGFFIGEKTVFVKEQPTTTSIDNKICCADEEHCRWAFLNRVKDHRSENLHPLKPKPQVPVDLLEDSSIEEIVLDPVGGEEPELANTSDRFLVGQRFPISELDNILREFLDGKVNTFAFVTGEEPSDGVHPHQNMTAICRRYSFDRRFLKESNVLRCVRIDHLRREHASQYIPIQYEATVQMTRFFDNVIKDATIPEDGVLARFRASKGFAPLTDFDRIPEIKILG